MNLKEFLRPTGRKLILAVVLVSASLLYQRPNYCSDATCYPRGFPLPFADEFSGTLRTGQLHYPGYLAIDFIFWFAIACVIAHVARRKQ